MRTRSHLLTVAIAAALATAAPAATPPPTTAPADFAWTNPFGPHLRDPQIQQFEGTYYMAATCLPFFEGLGRSPGVMLWSSRDLLHWDAGRLIVRPVEGRWYQQRFWAPEVFHDPDDGKWYCTVNCPAGGENADTPQAVCLAVADAVTGPYRVLTQDKPLTGGNDASLFRDDDGRTYLFRSGLSAIEVDLPHAKTVGQSFDVLAKRDNGEWDGGVQGAPAVGLEGPTVLKIGKTYYCFYSSWGRGYEVGIATADNVHGPWTRTPESPVYGAQDAAWAKRYKHAYTQTDASPYGQVGHNSVFVGPDGRWWIAAHAIKSGADVLSSRLVIDPLNFKDGVFGKTPVSYTPQHVPTTRP